MAQISDDTHEVLDLGAITYEPDGKLFCAIKAGQFIARFKKSAYYTLADHFEEDASGIVLVVGGQRRLLVPA